jgi:pyruvate dehydrogenase E1 component beta subunit
MREILYRDAVAEALDEEMARDENVLLIGEDVAFIGGNFKTSVGLYEKYGGLRVKDTPISEAGFVGMGVGMALTGLRPVVELMFSDFLLVAADQVVNQMAKIRYMSGGQATVPMVIRAPIGGGRSSAAQHSQSMQAMVSQFPGMKVLAPSTAQEVKGLLKSAIRDDNPVIFFEHKMEYSNKFMIDDDVELIPIGKADIKRVGSDISIVATSSQVIKSLKAADILEKEGISCEVIDLRSIIPLDRETIIQSVRRTGKLLIVDEAYEFCGIGAEIAANLMEDVFYDLDAPIARLATPNVPLPFSPALELPIIPSVEKITDKVRALIRQAGQTEQAGRIVKMRITPLAARIAEARGVDLSSVSGSGANGKIVRADVQAVIARANGSPEKLAAEESVRREASCASGGVPDGAGHGASGNANLRPGGKRIASVTPYTGIRKIIGERLASSKFTAPHLYFTQKIELSELLKLRKRVNLSQNVKVSVTDCIARACVLTLLKYPDLNASLAGEQIELYANVNIGVAVAAGSGLIVPVIKDAQELSLIGISAEAAQLVNKAREGKLTPDEYSGGTFTISNLGMFGIDNFTAILNPPEAGILAVSAAKDEAAVIPDENGEKSIAVRPTMNVTLSVDHRLIDGLAAAQFVAEIKRLLENPIELLI